MQIKLSKEANLYLNATIKKIAETNEVNKETHKKLVRLAARFNPDADSVNLKKDDALSISRLLEVIIEVCDALLQDKDAPADKIKAATKRKEIFNVVRERISEAIAANAQ